MCDSRFMPAASSGRWGGGFTGGGCDFECEVLWGWVVVVLGMGGCSASSKMLGDLRLRASRAGRDMSNRSMAFEM